MFRRVLKAWASSAGRGSAPSCGVKLWIDTTSGTPRGLSRGLPRFLIDRHEVTNRQFKAFVDAGGYRDRQFWTVAFVKDGKPVTGGEKDARQVFHRLAGCWRHWGETRGYFDTTDDAQAFYDEMCRMLADQRAAPNSPQWFNTGLHFAYGIDGPAQGHLYVDEKTGEVKGSTSA